MNQFMLRKTTTGQDKVCILHPVIIRLGTVIVLGKNMKLIKNQVHNSHT